MDLHVMIGVFFEHEMWNSSTADFMCFVDM